MGGLYDAATLCAPVPMFEHAAMYIYIYIYVYTYIHICMYIHICVYQASHSIVGGLDTRIGLVRGLGSQGQGWRQPEQATVLIMIYGLSVWFLYPLWL